MRRTLLILALLLMSVSATSPIWVGWARRDLVHHSRQVLVKGRVTGDFPDTPWVGTIVTLGNETKSISADGTFSFAARPGMHILRVCCSTRFQSIYREVSVADSDVELELEARPLLEISGLVITPKDKAFKRALKVSAWLIGTNRVDRTVVYSDGTFTFYLIEGDWRLDLDNLPIGYTLESMTLDGREVRDRTFTIPSAKGPSLPLRITLK